MTKKTGRIARIDRNLDSVRRRLLDKGLADGLTDIDKIIAKDLEQMYFKEKKGKEKDPLGGWY